MPKEITHWRVAKQAYHCLAACPLKQLISRHLQLYLAGAVVFDSPAYVKWGAARGKAAAIVNGLHDTAADTYAPIFQLLKEEPPAGSPLWAFIAGLLSHVVTDAVFHPFVFYFAGTGVSSAVMVRHHLLETLLDNLIMAKHPLAGQGRFANLRPSLGTAERLDWLRRFYLSQALVTNAFVKLCLRRHAFFQRLYFSRIAMNALRLVHSLSGCLESYPPLFYPAMKPAPRAYNRLFAYRHPVTGEALADSPATLEQRAVERCRVLYHLFGEPADGGRRLIDHAGLGPNLNTGMPNTRRHDMCYSNTRAHIGDMFCRP